MDSRSLGLELETDLSQRDLNGELNDLYERDILDPTVAPRDYDDSLLRSIQRRAPPVKKTPPPSKPPSKGSPSKDSSRKGTKALPHGAVFVDMGKALPAGPGVTIGTYGLDTCIGLAIVSGDGRNKIFAHVSALSQTHVMQKIRELLHQHRNTFQTSAAYLSVPGTSGRDSPTTPAREDMIRNVKTACTAEGLSCATKIRDRTHQPGPGEGEMYASDEGVFMDGKKV